MLTQKLGQHMKRELREQAHGAGIVEDLSLWRVARKPRAGADYSLRYQGDEPGAWRFYKSLDIRQGAARLLAPGEPIATAAALYTAGVSGPNLRTVW